MNAQEQIKKCLDDAMKPLREVAQIAKDFGFETNIVQSAEKALYHPAVVGDASPVDEIMPETGFVVYNGSGTLYSGEVGANRNDDALVRVRLAQDTGKIYFRDLRLTQIELIERAAWARGEGHGNHLRHYAFAIENLSKVGSSKWVPTWDSDVLQGRTPEERMKIARFNEAPKIFYPAILEHGNYAGFMKAYKEGKLDTLSTEGGSFTASATEAIREVIIARLGLVADITNGATNWGGAIPLPDTVASYEATIPKQTKDGFTTYFYKVNYR